jgi:hypothetical protein
MNTDRRGMARIFAGWTVLHAASALILAVILFADSRQILGINGWIKPFKFAVSGMIYLATLAILTKHLPESYGEAKGKRAAWIISAMIFGEVVLISLQSARGVISHFNREGIFNILVYNAMGVMIIVNTVVFTRMFSHFFKGEQKIPGPYLAGIRWGAVLFVTGSLVGGAMSGLNRHTIGVPDGGPGLPFLNFSTVAGDLRITHFLGLHALQILPLFGWVMGRLQRESGVAIFGSLYAIALVALFIQALGGYPLLAP